jgi:hypothetical protein
MGTVWGNGKCPAFGCKYTGKSPKQLTQHLKRHAGWEKVSCRWARPNKTWNEEQFETEEKCRSHRRNRVCLRQGAHETEDRVRTWVLTDAVKHKLRAFQARCLRRATGKHAARTAS